MSAVRVLLTDGRVRLLSLVSDRNTAQCVYVHRFMSITFFCLSICAPYTHSVSELILAFSYVYFNLQKRQSCLLAFQGLNVGVVLPWQQRSVWIVRDETMAEFGGWNPVMKLRFNPRNSHCYSNVTVVTYVSRDRRLWSLLTFNRAATVILTVHWNFTLVSRSVPLAIFILVWSCLLRFFLLMAKFGSVLPPDWSWSRLLKLIA